VFQHLLKFDQKFWGSKTSFIEVKVVQVTTKFDLRGYWGGAGIASYKFFFGYNKG
jgi:hypothetical protein